MPTANSSAKSETSTSSILTTPSPCEVMVLKSLQSFQIEKKKLYLAEIAHTDLKYKDFFRDSNL